jgi:hypothetical protein
MSNQSRPAAGTEKVPAKMKIRFHVYPDARATTKRGYCSAWSRRYGRSLRPMDAPSEL